MLIFNLEPRLPGNERRLSAPDALGKSNGTLRPLLSVALRLFVGGVLEYRDRVGFARQEVGQLQQADSVIGWKRLMTRWEIVVSFRCLAYSWRFI